MSELEKIKEQEDVMNSYNQNLVVSASAGSGKTSVMIRKIIDYILNRGLTVKDILVLTYTNFASEEMKQKLISALKEASILRQDIFEQLDDVPLADISTFDSFCQKIVKKYFYLIDVDPSFSVLDESEQTFYQNLAMKKAIETYKQKNRERYFALFNCFADNRTDKNIYEIVLSIYNFSCSVLDYEKFKQNAFALFLNDKAEKIYKEYVDFKVDGVISNLKTLLSVCQKMQLEKHCVFICNILEFAQFIKKNDDLGEIINFCLTKPFPQKPKLNDDYMDKIVYEKDILKEVVETFKTYGDENQFKKSKIFCKNIVETLFELCDEFKSKYESIKRNKNMFDFNDIERLTILVLEHEEVAKDIRSKYKQIFIDEFQDANLVQEKIISLIKDEDNLFLVGDLKQAIYGFRQSNSKIFERVIKQYKEENKTNGKSNALKLNSNFRTQKEILDFVNNIFVKIMTTKSAGLDYKGACLEPRAKFQGEDYNVELNIICDSDEEENQEINSVYSVSGDIQNLSSDRLEATLVAERITRLLGEKIYDINKKEYRQISYSDICILFRTRNKQAEFVEVFEKYGIPLVENSNLDLEQTYDVTVLINTIRVCENFNDDYSLASVMMSPLFDFTSEEMLEIRKVDKKHFYECVLNYDILPTLKEKIKNMQSTLNQFYNDYTFKGLYFALTNILNATNYLYKLTYLENGLSRQSNIQTFVNSFADSKFNFCAGEYISFLKQNTRKIKVASQASSFDCVTLTTMHASKGLEWPIVFCVSLGQDFFRSPKKPKVALNEELGVAVKYYDETNRKKYESVYFDVIKKRNFYDDFAEKLRLLYVALTRAKNKLFLVGTTNKLNYQPFKNENEIFSQRSFLNLIVKSLDEKSIEHINNIKDSNLFNNEKMRLKVVKSADFDESIKKDTIVATVQDEDQTNIAEYINAKYKYIDQTKIAQKNSVSGILKQDFEYTSQNYEPENLSLDEHLKFKATTDEGIVYHKILEMIDFNKEINIDTINSIIRSLRKDKAFADDLLNGVDKTLVQKNANKIKDIVKGCVVVKERSFVMEMPYSDIEESNINEKVIIQGVCDLIAIKDDSAVLIDYKFSSKTPQNLEKTYNKQLYLYKKAIENGLNKKVKNVYILSLKTANLFEIFPHK